MIRILLGLLWVVGSCGRLLVGQEEAESTTPAEPGSTTEEVVAFDEVKLKNGSVIVGKIIDMTDGVLTIETAFGVDDVVKVKWAEIESVASDSSHKFRLAAAEEDGEGRALEGRVLRTEDGSLVIQGGTPDATVTVELGQVTAINPPEEKLFSLKGSLNFGGSVQDGNTQAKAFNMTFNAVAKYDPHRFTIDGAYNYATNLGVVSADNARGSFKYDYFVTERVFGFASMFLETDAFQDLDLRAAVSVGPGYQLFKPGDFEAPWVSKLDFYGEVGVSYFSENFITAPNKNYPALRWALKLDWPILDDKVTLFLKQEGYPSIDDFSDVYIVSEQGVRFNIWNNFIATFQFNWRWNNSPSPGTERNDAQYLFTLGYQFDV